MSAWHTLVLFTVICAACIAVGWFCSWLGGRRAQRDWESLFGSPATHTVPVVYGANRVDSNLIDYCDFSADHSGDLGQIEAKR